MAYAARKYDRYAYQEKNNTNFATVPNRETEQQFKTRPRAKASVGEANLHSGVVILAAVIISVLLFAFLMFGVVTMISAQTSLNKAYALDVQEQINAVKYDGEKLELEHAKLSSLNRINTESTKLGMQAAGVPTYITLPNLAQKATSATFADGSLSLSGTIANIQNANYSN